MYYWIWPSGTNYLVPNEMMTCGLPVVDIDAEHTRLSYQPETVLLAEPTPSGLAASLSILLNNPSLRESSQTEALRQQRIQLGSF